MPRIRAAIETYKIDTKNMQIFGVIKIQNYSKLSKSVACRIWCNN